MTSVAMQLSPDRVQYLKKRKQQKGQAQVLLVGASILAAILFLCLMIAAIVNAGSLFKTTPVTPSGNHTLNPNSLQPVEIPTANKADGPLVLVNSSHYYEIPENTDNLVKIFNSRTEFPEGYSYKVSGSNLLLDSKALTALNQFMDAFYQATGERDAIINSAFRTKAEQTALGSSIKAGYSDSHTGYLVSIKVYKNGTTYNLSDPAVAEKYQWLTDNCYRYGFVVRYPADKSMATGVSDYTNAFRYVGVAHATYMHENNLCLEEYVELLRNQYAYTGNHLTINTADSNYEVFYIPASSEEKTTIYKTDDALVSGDNVNGFIVTVPKA